MKKRLVIGGGGTAGHVYPSLRVAEMVAGDFDEVLFIGGKNSLEQALCEKNNVPFQGIQTAKFDRSRKYKLPLAGIQNIQGIWQALRIMRKQKPDAVFVSGGFASVPVVIAAKLLGVDPIVTHVCDRTLGLAQKLSRPFSTHITTTFKETAESLKRGVFTGPITPPLPEHKQKSGNEKPLLLVYGGSQGAEAINQKVRSSLDGLLEQCTIAHVCGKGNVQQKLQGKEGYEQFEFVYDFPSLLAKADGAICRGGSNSLWELILAEIPHLAVPLPLTVSRGDQIENCKYFAQKGVTRYQEQEEFMSSDLVKEITGLFQDANEIRQAMQQIKSKKPAQYVIQQILVG